jgi:hypothetical protein
MSGERLLMKKRTVGASLAATALMGMISATSASAVEYRAHWLLDEPNNPSIAYDATSNANNGQNENITGTGTGYIFNGSSRVVVADSASLSPGASDFQFGVTVVSGVPTAGTDYDLLRKGFASTAGGEFKVEILNVSNKARPMCLVKDSLKHVASIRGGPAAGIADGKAHSITCSKTSSGVTITVDGVSKTKTIAATLGIVANSGSLTLGAKDGYSPGDVNGDWSKVTLLDAWMA